MPYFFYQIASLNDVIVVTRPHFAIPFLFTRFPPAATNTKNIYHLYYITLFLLVLPLWKETQLKSWRAVIKKDISFPTQNHQSQSHHLSWPQWVPPTCGSSSMLTLSTVTALSSRRRWSTALCPEAWLTTSPWISPTTRSGTLTQTLSMRSVFF